MNKPIITLNDLRDVFRDVPPHRIDYYADAFWTLFSHGVDFTKVYKA